MRADAHLFVRLNAQGFADCDAARWRERLLHPDHKLWNFQVQTDAQRRLSAKQTTANGGRSFAAELAHLRAQHLQSGAPSSS
jgi:hypothetical protein